jgi:transcriptional regulator with XRE-family HTH domain
MKTTSLKDIIKEYTADPRNERLVAESRAGRLLTDVMRSLRDTAGLTQVALAERLGRPQSFVAKLESGGYERCNVGTLTTVARAMGFELDFDHMFRKVGKSVFSGEVEVDFEAELNAELDPEAQQLRVILHRRVARAGRKAFDFTKKQRKQMYEHSTAEAAAA